MKKRVIAMMCVAAMAATMATGCSSGSTASSSTADSSAADSSAAASTEATAEAGDWEPSGTVTIIAAAAAGSGYDTSARSFAQVLNSTGIVENTIKVVNDSGAAGQVGFTNFALNEVGNNEALIAASTASITIAVANGWDVGYEDFTQLGKLVIDSMTFVCNTDNEDYDTIEEITAALQADPKSIKFGAAPAPDPDYIGFVLYLDSIGVNIADIEYVSYEGGGEIIPAVMGGHVDIGLSGGSEFSAAVEGGQVKPVAVAADARLGGAYSDTPTLKESGIDLSYGNWRGIWGPKDMDPEAVAYWQNALTELSESEEWAEMCVNMQWDQDPTIEGITEWTGEFQEDVIRAMQEAGIIG